MSKSNLAILAVLILAIAGVWVAYVNIKPQTQQSIKTNSAPEEIQINTNNTTNNQSQNGKTVTLPFNIYDPSVQTTVVVYTFDTTIKSVVTTQKGTEIISTITNPNVPQFLIDKQTTVFFSANNKFQPATPNDLQKGQEVRIRMAYGLRTKAWKLTRVDIIVSLLPSPVVTPK